MEPRYFTASAVPGPLAMAFGNRLCSLADLRAIHEQGGLIDAAGDLYSWPQILQGAAPFRLPLCELLSVSEDTVVWTEWHPIPVVPPPPSLDWDDDGNGDSYDGYPW